MNSQQGRKGTKNQRVTDMPGKPFWAGRFEYQAARFHAVFCTIKAKVLRRMHVERICRRLQPFFHAS